MERHGIAYTMNPRLVRGLDYYNLTVFEWVTDRLGAQGTICGGGRYDSLIEQMGGAPAPACGFAIGVERLIALLQEVAAPELPAALDVYVVHWGEAWSVPPCRWPSSVAAPACEYRCIVARQA